MKVFNIILCIVFSLGTSYAQQNTGPPNGKGRSTPDLDNWTEEQIVMWEDSVKKALYPEPVIGFSARPEPGSSEEPSKGTTTPLNFTNSHVPDSYPVNKAMDVGEIPMNSSVSPSRRRYI